MVTGSKQVDVKTLDDLDAYNECCRRRQRKREKPPVAHLPRNWPCSRRFDGR